MFHAHTVEEEATVNFFETTSKKGQVTKYASFSSIGMKVICMLELGSLQSCGLADLITTCYLYLPLTPKYHIL